MHTTADQGRRGESRDPWLFGAPERWPGGTAVEVVTQRAIVPPGPRP